MFEKLTPIYRLLLCLFLSVGVHGGLVAYGLMASAAKIYVVDAPVVVSLLPATKAVVPVEEESLRPTPAPLAPVRTEQPRVEPRPVAAAVKKTIAKVFPKRIPKIAKIEEPIPAPDPTLDEAVCMTPQEVVLDNALPPVESISENTDSVADDSVVEEVRSILDRSEETRPSIAVNSTAQAITEATPNYRSNPLPEYPFRARLRHWEGTVWLLVDVSSEGDVEDLKVEKSSGHRVLDRAASKTVRRWQFTPAKRAGLPVSSQARIPVRFRLEDG